MTKLFTILFLTIGLFSSTMIQAQRVSPADLRVYTEDESGRGPVKFFVENNLRKDFHIVVRFDLLRGYTADHQLPFNENIPKGRRLIFTLNASAEQGSDYQFTWYYWEEVVAKKIKVVEYLLPVAAGENVQVLEPKGIDPIERNGMNTIGFKVDNDAVVHAVRKGRVIEIVNDDINSEKNKMVIRHEDQSKTEYFFLKKDGFLVDELDYIDAGDPIAKAGRKTYSDGVQIHIRTSYLLWDRYKRKEEAYTRHNVKMKFTTTKNQAVFLTPGQTYTSIHSMELISQEMSRREIKNRFKKKKKKK